MEMARIHEPPTRGRRKREAVLAWPGIVIIILVVLIALSATVPAVAAGRQDCEKVLTGGFDVGPAGCAECFNPLQAGAGFTWLEKCFSKLVLYNVELTEI